MQEIVKCGMPFATVWVLRLPPGFKDLGEMKDPALYKGMVESRSLI